MKAAELSETSARTFTTPCSSHIQKNRTRMQEFPELPNIQEISAQGEFCPSRISVHTVCDQTYVDIQGSTFDIQNSNSLQTD
jgi:hypothetical protein